MPQSLPAADAAVTAGAVRASTRLAGTVADPVAHVQAPESMGRWLAAHGVDAVWLPFHVHPDGLPAFVGGVRALANMAGFTVTMPHKRAVLGLVDAAGPRATRAGVANMVRREPDGRLVADNADGIGFVEGLAASRVPVRERTVWLVGAGGAGTAIAWALAEQGPAHLAVSDADAAQAARLAGDIAAAFPVRVAAGTPDPDAVDIAINATPCGLHPGDPLPFEPASLRRDAVVVDIIMNPKVTALLRRAAALGLATVPGQRMLDGQLAIYARFLGLVPAAAAGRGEADSARGC